MIFTETKIPGVFVIELERRRDERGFFARQWCADINLRALGSTRESPRSTRVAAAGALRGAHYQRVPDAEVKLARCTRGAVFDAAVALRAGSPTFCQWFGTELDDESGRMLYIPEGCGHGGAACSIRVFRCATRGIGR